MGNTYVIRKGAFVAVVAETAARSGKAGIEIPFSRFTDKIMAFFSFYLRAGQSSSSSSSFS